MQGKNSRVGKTGWLTPTGVFIPCKYQGHRDVAEDILSSDYDKARQDLYIPMGSRGPGFEMTSYIHIPETRLTHAQLEWLRENYTLLDEVQQHWLNRYGRHCGWVEPGKRLQGMPNREVS